MNNQLKLGFIGAGQMARALAKGMVAAGVVDAKNVWASDCFPAACQEFQQVVPNSHAASDNAKVVEAADVIFLAVKPQQIPTVAPQLKPISEDKLLLSIAAGTTLDQLSKGFGSNRIVRIMPNTPCLVGKGAAAFAMGSQTTDDDEQLVKQLLSSVGIAFSLEEKQLDAVTGLSGSGPAFVYLFIEALSDAGVRVGLPRNVASQLAAQTVSGAASMVLETAEHPGVLKDRVASPAGTTIAGIEQLEKHAFRGTVMDAVVKATERSIELGKQ